MAEDGLDLSIRAVAKVAGKLYAGKVKEYLVCCLHNELSTVFIDVEADHVAKTQRGQREMANDLHVGPVKEEHG